MIVVAAAGRGEPGPVGHVTAVEDHHQVADVAGIARCEVAATVELVGQQFVQLGHRPGDQTQPSDGVLPVGVQCVRQPLQPVPLTTVIRGDTRGDHEFVGGVECGEMGDDGTDVGADIGQIAVVPDLRETPKAHRHGQFADRVVGADEASQCPGADRVEVGDRLGLRAGSA